MPAEQQEPENLGVTVNEVAERVTVLVREEVELAKAEVTVKAKSLGRGAAAIAAGAVFGVFAVIFLLLTIAWGLNSLLGSIWLGFLIVFGVLLLATIGAVYFATRKLRVGPPVPTMAIDEAKRIRSTVQHPERRL
ncbi:MAG: phage holin family protein [Solirubrobacteraceae bacterium]